jgi:hypothetical protein
MPWGVNWAYLLECSSIVIDLFLYSHFRSVILRCFTVK